ncbi:MAG TPA: PP2C family protein-serine/threonine phosphatase [Ilumatobacteraceae bacterium]
MNQHASARRQWLPWAVLLSSLAVFVVLAVACRLIYDDAEQQLLQERTEEASSALALSVSQIRAPLDAAATIARATGGDPLLFADPLSAALENETFDSGVLYDFDTGEALASVGGPVSLEDGGPEAVRALIESTTNDEQFVIVDLLGAGRRLGYAVVDDALDPQYVVYGERQLSADPNLRRRIDAPFSDLDYAIYLGTEEVSDKLLGSSVRDLPIDGRRAAAVSEFGDEELLLVTSPIGQLSSPLLVNLWWIVAVVGLALSLAAAWLTSRLHASREQAMALADDNARLYEEQRHIAETLQLSLLPQELVAPAGGSVAARYWPAGTASLIGGDFYDAFRVDERRWAVVIGDVCGKGIEAAAITGLVRHTVRAAARATTSPAEVLLNVHQALSDQRPPTFCTVCFFYVTIGNDGSQVVTISLGGHPPPLLRRADGTVEEIGRTGSLLGMFPPTLRDDTVIVRPDDTIVLYTDGFTDAPGDQGVPIEELIDLLATQGDVPVSQLADAIRPLKRRRRPHGSHDDTAIIVLRFGSPMGVSEPSAAADVVIEPEGAHT